MNKKRSKLTLWIPIVIILVGAIGFGVWKFIDTRTENQELQQSLDSTTQELNELKEELITNPNGAIERSQEERTAVILEEVGTLYELPEGETPTIATVQDIEKLKDQPFFSGAQNGDQLIVFDESSTAILYRPSEKRLVKVGPINIDDSPEVSSPDEE
jgi:cytoskeletal protein RodZ